MQATISPVADQTCAQGIANTTPVTPTVWLILDGSGSMDERFDGTGTRWQALRSSLMGDGGVVATLARSVRFGMVLYSGIDQQNDQTWNDGDPQADPAMPADDAPSLEQCVDLEVVDPALDNYATLDARFPAEELGGWTPTDRALEYVVDNLEVAQAAQLDADLAPTYVIMATDGAPNDHCAGDNQSGRGGRGGNSLDPVVAERVLSAVQRGAEIGMKLFVISLAGSDQELQGHLDEVARLSGTGVAPFVPATRDDLVDTLLEIVGAATCRVELDGNIADGAECRGEVLLNGNSLACNADDGFRLVDSRTLQLTGSACDSFLGSASQVRASFPCGAFTVD